MDAETVQNEYDKIKSYLDNAEGWEGISKQTRVHVQDKFQLLFELVFQQHKDIQEWERVSDKQVDHLTRNGKRIISLEDENERYKEAVKLALETLENNNLMNDEYKKIHSILDCNGNIDMPGF